MILRIHHCYADGIALIQVLLSMTDADREGQTSRAGPDSPRQARPTRTGIRSRELLAPLSGVLKMASQARARR